MADWTTLSNGHWTDASNWTGGIPNAAGATANFTASSANSLTALIGFAQDETVRVGTINITTDSDDGWAFQGNTGVTSATLRFQGVGGGPAFINVDTNNSVRHSTISGNNGLNVTLASDLIVTTANSDSDFEISAPITGGFDVYKYGTGTFRLSGDNLAMTGDYFLNGGRTELDSVTAVRGGSIMKLNNGATLASTISLILSNDIETGTGNASGNIVAKTGTSLLVSGDLLLRSSAVPAIRFGTAADAGTIDLSGTCSVTGTGGFELGGGTLRFRNAAVAANYFANLASSAGMEVKTGATLDTRGFAATIDNLDMDGGTIQSSTGSLNLTSDQTASGNVQTGTIVGTAQADQLIFNVAGNADLSGLTFTTWTDGTDTITINGNASANSIFGSSRNDTINGGGGADTMRGLAGNDVYFIDNAADVVVENVGEGDDRVFASVSYALAASAEVETLTTTANDGTGAIDLTGSDTANFIAGNNGVNTLLGRGGNDVLASFAGSDVLDGGAGADIMIGGTGNDFYFVDNVGDVVTENVGEGDDRVFAGVSYALASGAEVETLTTTANDGTGAIDLAGSNSANFILGNDGINTLNGGGGNDVLASRAGNDVLNGGTGADTMIGGTGNDIYHVDNAGDVVTENAGEGDDRVFAAVSFALAAGAEVETLTTNANDGTAAIDLTGSDSANFIAGNDGANLLRGAGGNDFLAAGAGIDWLDGGTGNDTLQGGVGIDAFAFTASLIAGNADTILDFVGGTDKIMLDDAIFAGLAMGALSATAFVAGTSAQDADDRIIYDQATGKLFFDADGNGAGAAVQFATLDTHPAIAAGDFVVI